MSKFFSSMKSVFSSLPLEAAIRFLIDQLSNMLNLIAPDELSEEERETMQKVVGSVYAAGKNFGPDLVQSSTTTIDDALLKELFEICEQAAEKYELQLNPVVIEF